MWFIIILGIIVFLLMEHPIAFWIVFVPLIILFIASIVSLIQGRSLGAWFSNYAMIMISFVAMIIALMVVCIP